MTEDMTRRYIFKLFPTPEQANALHEQRKMCAEIWNALLQRREDVYRRERRSLSWYTLDAEISQMYAACPEWRALSTYTARLVNKNLDRAFAAFFRRLKAGEAEAGYPHYKRRENGNSIPHDSRSGCQLRHREGHGKRSWTLRFKGVPGIISARGKFPCEPSKMTVANVLWRGGEWMFSVCVEIAPRRTGGRCPMMVELGILDGFARVNGEIQTPDELVEVMEMEVAVDRLKSERDKSAGGVAGAEERDQEIRDMQAAIARKRSNALHVWTARIVAEASDLTVIVPPTKEATASPRGNRRDPGANVETVSAINRTVLCRAPYTAQLMLSYKAAEAGIRCDVITDPQHLVVGPRLVEAGKTLRRARKTIRKQERKAA